MNITNKKIPNEEKKNRNKRILKIEQDFVADENLAHAYTSRAS